MNPGWQHVTLFTQPVVLRLSQIKPTRLRATRLIAQAFTLSVALFLATGLLGKAADAQNTYTVTSTNDDVDAALGDENCETSNGECTFRAAINEANQSTAVDTIEFGDLSAEGSAVIFPATPLPNVSETTIIDGTTEPNYTAGEGPVVALDGDSISGSGSNGLVFYGEDASASHLKALAIINFSGEGIQIQRGAQEVTIEECYIGVRPDGTTAAGNGGSGIWIGSNNNQIGTSDGGNLISGNGNIGIEISGEENEVRENLIGVTANADAPLPNGSGSFEEGGVIVSNGPGNALIDNVIAGNDGQGIFIKGRSYRNSIRSNYVGTSQALSDLGNTFNGIRVDSSPESNDGEVEVYDNIVGFNRIYGISINGNYVDISNNYIGTTPDGANIGNYITGLRVAARHVVVGSSEVGGEEQPGNVIGFNGFSGIRMLEGRDNIVRGNYIGTNRERHDFDNQDIGIEIRARGAESAGHVIGYGFDEVVPPDPSPSNGGQGNVIAHNEAKGIDLVEKGGTVSGNAVRGNSIHSNGRDNDEDVGIDLGDDGATENDAGDGDEGSNNLQNAPEIDADQIDYDSDAEEVTVRYKVDTDPSHADFGSEGLKIDFYVTGTGSGGEGKRHLYTDRYPESEATSFREITFETPAGANVSESDRIVATATDAEGNTSEFTAPPGAKLSVELAKFEGSQVGESEIELIWETTLETNSDGFEVQHKRKEGSWSKIGFVESKAEGGTSAEAKRYKFVAEGLPVGTHQFRLKQLDLDGSAYVHNPVTVELGMQEARRLSPPAPHPVSAQSTISFAVKEQIDTRVALYNILGQEVAILYEGTPGAEEQQTVQLDASGLSSGIYMLRLEAGGKAKTRRVTVVQ